MYFRKKVGKEKQEVLLELLKTYKKEMKMTLAERRELEKWVAAGHSPYDNGDYIYGENGWPLDFISALRSAEDEMERFRNLTPEEQQEYLHPTHETYQEETLSHIEFPFDVAEDLPFQL